MLQHLRMEDYALMDCLDVEFHAGFGVLTGETGSGKSIVVDAVNLLLGEKASAELIRAGAERARIVGTFSAAAEAASAGGRFPRSWKQITALLLDGGIEAEEGGDLILQRDLLAEGRSRVFINNQPATVSLLKKLAPHLAEVHGQNEQQQLLQAGEQLAALDRFARLEDPAIAVAERFACWKQLRSKFDELVQQKQEWQRELDLWRFQHGEIEQAGIVAGEDQRLEQEKRLLAHADRIQARLAASYDLLYDAPQAAAASLASAERQLEELASFDESLLRLAETLAAARASVEDTALAVRDRLSRLEASPGRLEEVQARLAQLDRLQRKYGRTLEDVLAFGKQLQSRIAETEASEATTQALEQQVRDAATDYHRGASKLSQARARAAKELQRAVEKELAALAMPGTVFEAALTVSAEEAAWRSSGIDRVEFLLCPNPGEPLRPLARIASGGEISRIMLALETVTSTRPSAVFAEHTLVFDEVDAGIGGRAAEMVGRKLRQLGETRQVLCVTHLPQIASFAHDHFRVEKREQDGRTVTRVERLNTAGRREELARMLSGSQITPAVLQHAAQLLKTNAG